MTTPLARRPGESVDDWIQRRLTPHMEEICKQLAAAAYDENGRAALRDAYRAGSDGVAEVKAVISIRK